jgi:phage tail sheath gpL-like
MRDIPVNLGGFKLRVAEEPTMKMREKDGQAQPVTVDGVTQFTVSLFAKRAGQKGEEIKVTLATDPGEGFGEGDLVELIDATVSPYSFKNSQGETVSGIAFKAAGLTPLG